MSIFFAWADILSEKNLYFGKHLSAKQGLIMRTSFVYKCLRLVRISLLISTLNKRVLLFFCLESYFKKAIRKLFSCVCISWYKHERGWENSWQLCKPETKSRVCITVSNSPNPSCVYIRLCKHGKRFLLLKSRACFLLCFWENQGQKLEKSVSLVKQSKGSGMNSEKRTTLIFWIILQTFPTQLFGFLLNLQLCYLFNWKILQGHTVE